MATQTYELFFGTANAGGSPAWARFARSDTHAALTQPTITEIGNGLYRFSWDWSSSTATAIEYIATLNGVELWDVISSVSAPGSVTVTGSTYSTSGYSTAGTILNRAAVQLGLIQTYRTDPFDGLDANFVRLAEYLRTIGDDLTRDHDWTHMVKEATFVTDGVSTSYALPADFNDFMDQSGWNRSTRWPLIGPLSSQDRQYLKARLVNILLQVAFSIQGNLLTLPIVPPTGATIAFEYASRFWVQSAAGSSADSDSPVSKDDICLLDPLLLIRGIVLEYIKHGGPGDVVAAQADYDKTLEYCIGKNTGGGVLALGRRARPFDRLIDGRNFPEGNWGVS